MSNKQNEQGAEEWDAILNQLRQVRQQVQEQGPLPEQEKAEAAEAFRRGLALLESQVQNIQDDQSGLKGSSGVW
ncbi:hypothetical protein [Hymenobacter wooponensis]|uniref:Uncharacterized protein n=1 Tax=Hymenobacter wooponensis TaxID=1525360 RepID=A0A4Z0MQ34_9BACT|nr:hypothetical protein [Hymenobacter wooponensis]TGD81529.1 hypothetical protein EU557_08210 [Hymenobacter wooponensis]